MKEEEKLMEHIKGYHNKILNKVRDRVDDLFLDSPVDDFTEREEGYESALADVKGEIERLRIL